MPFYKYAPQPHLPVQQAPHVLVIVLFIAVAVIAFILGWVLSTWHFIQADRTRYPFLLLDPSQYMACYIGR